MSKDTTRTHAKTPSTDNKQAVEQGETTPAVGTKRSLQQMTGTAQPTLPPHVLALFTKAWAVGVSSVELMKNLRETDRETMQTLLEATAYVESLRDNGAETEDCTASLKRAKREPHAVAAQAAAQPTDTEHAE